MRRANHMLPYLLGLYGVKKALGKKVCFIVFAKG